MRCLLITLTAALYLTVSPAVGSWNNNTCLDNTDYQLAVDPCGIRDRSDSTAHMSILNDMNLLENIVRNIEVFSFMSRVSEQSATGCGEYMISLMCEYIFPVCDDNNQLRAPCSNSCTSIMDKCGKEWEIIENITRYDSQNETNFWWLSDILMFSISCDNLFYYGNSSDIEYDMSNCHFINTTSTPTTTPTNTPTSTPTPTQNNIFTLTNEQIVLITAGGLAIMACLPALCCVCGCIIRCIHVYRKRKKTEDELSLTETQTPSPTSRTLTRLVYINSHFVGKGKIRSKKSLLKLFPKDYAVVMGQYENQILQEDRLETSVFLADGKSTEVYQGTFADLQPYNAYLTRMVAIKKFKDTTQTDKIKRYIELFVQLQTIDHPNVLKLIGISYGPQYNIVIVYPFFSEHDLLTYLKKIRSQSDQHIKIRQLFDIIWQVSLGMEAISHYGIVYKHLSSRTCLVNQELTIVLGDYSYSNLVNGTCMYNKWRAPESITDNIYSEKTDVWSFGVTSWEILTLGDQPFEGLSSNEILAFVQNGHHLRRPTSCAWQLYEILKDCWSIQPHKRPDFNDIVSKLKTLKDDANFRDTLDNEVSLTGAVTPVCEVNYSLANGAIAVQVTAEDDDLFDEDGYIKVTPTLPVSSSIPS